jgi:hypothetical protein
MRYRLRTLMIPCLWLLAALVVALAGMAMDSNPIAALGALLLIPAWVSFDKWRKTPGIMQ